MAYTILQARYFATYNKNRTKNREEKIGIPFHATARSAVFSIYMAQGMLVQRLLFQIQHKNTTTRGA